ncbi:MAG: PilN domain-containing protein [Burkholderiaceae bacterium]|nr:PilN domain-containing protein [Burkholderiaceae bacterium]
MSQQINLFNPIFLRQKKHFSAVAMAQALGVIVLGVLALYLYSLFEYRGGKQDADKAAAQLAATQQQLAKVIIEYAPRKRSEAQEEAIRKAQAELDALQLATDRLKQDEFGDKKGYSAYLRAFARQIVSGLWLTGFSIKGAGSAIGIQGRTLQPETVPMYINRLKQETVLQGKSFATLEMEQAKPENDAPKVQKKTPVFIEFDLRSQGVEKTLPVAASATIGGQARTKANAVASASAEKATGASADLPGVKK